MKTFILFLISFSFVAVAKNVATFQKKGERQVQSISFKNASLAYKAVSQTTLNAPSKSQFIRDYIRYHVALKEAYNDKSLITTNNIQTLIVNPELKRNFDEILYKVYAASKMRGNLQTIKAEIQKLSNKSLRNSYRKNPYFKFYFIVLKIPSLASKKELRNTEIRANTIYDKIKRNKKSFRQLISLYSDDQNIGYTNNIYSRTTLYPLIYNTLKDLKPNQISKPVRTPNGFYILKLNEIVPFNRASRDNVREQIYNIRVAEVFNRLFNQMLARYNIKIDENMVRSL